MPIDRKRSGANARTPLLHSSYHASTIRWKKPESNQRKYLSTSACYANEKVFTASSESAGSSLRKPYHYPIDKQFIGQAVRGQADVESSAKYTRYMYYSKLAGNVPEAIESMRIPEHVVPYHFLIPTLPFQSKRSDHTQGSILTIFAVWNMLMGSSLLCLPWTINKSGLALGLIIIILMLFICFYTCNLIVTTPVMLNLKCKDFGEVCHATCGRFGQVLCVASSLLSLAGTCFVYWILLSNFIYNIISYLYDWQTSNIYNAYETLHLPTSSNVSSVSLGKIDRFHSIWDVSTTVPLYLAIVLLPVLFIRSPTFFMKFNAIGTISVVWLFSFVIFKAFQWGFFNCNFTDNLSTSYTPLIRNQFAVQIGVLSQGLLIQNCILTVLSLQRNPENNSRDLAIAYSLVGVCYITIGALVYLAFPHLKDLLRDNFLDNFSTDDVAAVVSRTFLFIQIFCLFPLFTFMLRTQLLNVILRKPNEAGFVHISLFNLIFCSLCVLVALKMPFIGTIIRFTGSFAGLILIFVFPSIVYLKALAKSPKKLVNTNWYHFRGIPHHTLLLNVFIVVFGFINCALQFYVE